MERKTGGLTELGSRLLGLNMGRVRLRLTKMTIDQAEDWRIDIHYKFGYKLQTWVRKNKNRIWLR